MLAVVLAAALASTALIHHAVSTTIPAAQEQFDEGLALVYAFNRDEARKRFEAAGALDPNLAIAWWGVALAVGPNLNENMTANDLATAREALAKARALEAHASPEERAYIDALRRRYPGDPKDDTTKSYDAYRDAMAALVAANPDDLDAATLYAESMMDLPGGLEYHDGQPSAALAKIAAVLQVVLARDPHHIGADHYWIHVWDHAGYAERALPEANYLAELHYEPAESHLQHMPGHTYLDVGDYAAMDAVASRSVLDDDADAVALGVSPSTLFYHRHNLSFWAGAALLLGDRAEIARVRTEYVAAASPEVLVLDARSANNAAVDAAVIPPDRGGARGDWYYARALVALDRNDVTAAQADAEGLDAWLHHHAADPDESRASLIVRARIAQARGDLTTTATLLRSCFALSASDAPESGSPWFYPAGQWLGDALLAAGRLTEAQTAYRDELARMPNDPRTLTGLQATLTRQGQLAQAQALGAEVDAVWRGDPSALGPAAAREHAR